MPVGVNGQIEMWAAIKSAFTATDERRVAPRVPAVGRVRVDSKTFALENWSTSGILVSGHGGHLAKGQKFKLSVEVHDGERLIEFNAEAVVVRIVGNKLAAQFFHIDRRKKQAIVEYFKRKSQRF